METIDKQDREYFVPVLQHRFLKDRMYIVEPKLQFKKNQQNKRQIFNDIIYPLVEKYQLDDVDEDFNWGILKNGKPIIYDYGF